jgi:hypothetical protein
VIFDLTNLKFLTNLNLKLGEKLAIQVDCRFNFAILKFATKGKKLSKKAPYLYKFEIFF